MAKISFPKFQSHLGLLSDIGGVLGFVGTIKALFFSDWGTLWAFTLQLNWFVGMVAFCVLLGWVVVLRLVLDSVGSLAQWLQWKNAGGRVLSLPVVEPAIGWFGFIVAGVVLASFYLTMWTAHAVAAKLKPEWETKKRDAFASDVFWLTYLVVAIIAGVYFALTVKPETVGGLTSMGWLIRPLGWLVLPLLAVVMVILLVKLWRRLFSMVFTTEDRDDAPTPPK